MITLNPDLLKTDDLFESDFDFSLENNHPRGSYNPMKSVIRLREDIHKALDGDEINSDKIQAFSTFMHETIHWWQHVGSHLGFITTISYPALAHLVHQDLKTLINRNEKFKSIIEYDQYIYSKTGTFGNHEVNRILNYYHDITFAKVFIADNNIIHLLNEDRRFFLNIGHCFHMLWAVSINVLSVGIDPNFTFIPKIKNWTENFKELENNKVPGFVTDMGHNIAKIGTSAIYEGQARFNQLQYLSIASGNTATYNDFAQSGMLEAIYVEAFNIFLELTGIERPDNLNNSVIGLFLLVCDIAINPVEGFPADILDYKSFIISNDPGMRFTMLCHTISKDRNKWKIAVQEYSREEYIDFSEQLCEQIVCLSPLTGSSIVANWAHDNISIQNLLSEEAEMRFKAENLSIRLFTSKYIRFQEDKIKYPSIFCWTGKSMTGEVSQDLDLEIVKRIFDKHRALFVDEVGGEIRPTIYEGVPEENIMQTFNEFYLYNTTYDMTMKWITEKGEFKYDYQWLTPNYSNEDMKNWIRNNFKDAYSIYPEELRLFKDS